MIINSFEPRGDTGKKPPAFAARSLPVQSTHLGPDCSKFPTNIFKYCRTSGSTPTRNTPHAQNTQIRAEAPESSPLRYTPGLGYAVQGIFRPMRPRAPQQCGSASSCLPRALKMRPPPGPPQDHQRSRSECVPCGQRGSARRGRRSRLPGGGGFQGLAFGVQDLGFRDALGAWDFGGLGFIKAPSAQRPSL